MGVRPEHITLTKESDAAHANCLKTTLHVCEMMGSELHLHLLFGEHKVIVRVPTLGLSDEELDSYQDGNEYYLSFVPEAMHLFDGETKTNLIYGG